jgi:hypothetical protein
MLPGNEETFKHNNETICFNHETPISFGFGQKTRLRVDYNSIAFMALALQTSSLVSTQDNRGLPGGKL